jgi:hypothetical protein
MIRNVTIIFLGVLSLGLGGCAERFAPVCGTVTLDGKPLEGAIVGFYPADRRGSHGVTDAQGRYELVYSQTIKGILPGQYLVRITTADVNTPERLPARYHERTELSAEVKPGDNVHDFALKSK